MVSQQKYNTIDINTLSTSHQHNINTLSTRNNSSDDESSDDRYKLNPPLGIIKGHICDSSNDEDKN